MEDIQKKYFEETLLNDNVLDALYDMRFDACTPIQAACIDPIIEGMDIMGVAQTGTGKTAAYLLPVLSRLDDGGYPEDAVNCLIMAPTRELAQQIDQAMQGFGYYLDGISSVAVYGGNDGNRYNNEMTALKKGASVVIATPGRLISHMQMDNIDLSKLSFFILDEADRMLDMGFSDDILTIAKQIPKSCQTIMFSATMPAKIEDLAKTLLKNPLNVKIAVSKPAEKIQQSAYVCYQKQKDGILGEIFKTQQKRVIIFSGKKQRVKEIYRNLVKKNVSCGAMHSDLSQAERDDMMFRFKSGSIDVLVATDIVARGIDIDDIQMVINYDVPRDVEDYVHRIGRTARAERDGIAITLVSDDEIYLFKRIEKFLGREIEKNALPAELGEAPDYKADKAHSTTANRNRKRHGGARRHGANNKNNTHNNTNPKQKKNERNEKQVRPGRKEFSGNRKRKGNPTVHPEQQQGS